MIMNNRKMQNILLVDSTYALASKFKEAIFNLYLHCDPKMCLEVNCLELRTYFPKERRYIYIYVSFFYT